MFTKKADYEHKRNIVKNNFIAISHKREQEKVEGKDGKECIYYIHDTYLPVKDCSINKCISAIEFVYFKEDMRFKEAFYYDKSNKKHQITNKQILEIFDCKLQDFSVNVTNDGYIIITNRDTIFYGIDFDFYDITHLNEILESENITDQNLSIVRVNTLENIITILNLDDFAYAYELNFEICASFDAKYGGMYFYIEKKSRSKPHSKIE